MNENEMTEEEVVELMGTSQNEDEWNRNCEEVKRRCGGYPKFWYKVIIASGLIAETLGEGSDRITIKTLD